MYFVDVGPLTIELSINLIDLVAIRLIRLVAV